MATHTSKASWNEWAINVKKGNTVESSQKASYNTPIVKDAEITSAKLVVTITGTPKSGAVLRAMTASGELVTVSSLGAETTIDVRKYINTDSKQSSFNLKMFFSYGVGSTPTGGSGGSSGSSPTMLDRAVTISTTTVAFTAELTVKWTDGSPASTFAPPTDYSVTKWCVETETELHWSGATGSSDKKIAGYRIWYKDYDMEKKEYPSGISGWVSYKIVKTKKGSGSCTVVPPETRGQKRRYAVQTLSDTEHPDALKKSSQLLTSFEYGTVFKNQVPGAPTKVQILPKDYLNGPITIIWDEAIDPDSTISKKPYSESKSIFPAVVQYEIRYSNTGGSDPSNWRTLGFTRKAPYYVPISAHAEIMHAPKYYQVRAMDDEGVWSDWSEIKDGYGELHSHQNPAAPIMKGFLRENELQTAYDTNRLWASGRVYVCFHTNGLPSSTSYRLRTRILDTNDQAITNWEETGAGVSFMPQSYVYASPVTPTVSVPGYKQVYEVQAVDSYDYKSAFAGTATIIRNTPPAFNGSAAMSLQLTYKESSSIVAKRSENPSSYTATLSWNAATDIDNDSDLQYEIQTRIYEKSRWGAWETVRLTSDPTWDDQENKYMYDATIPIPSSAGDIQEWRVRAVDSYGEYSGFTNTVRLMTKGLPLTEEEIEAMKDFMKTGLFVDEAGYVAQVLESETKPAGWEEPDNWTENDHLATVRIMTDVKGEAIKEAIANLKTSPSNPIAQATAAVGSIIKLEMLTLKQRLRNDLRKRIDDYIEDKLKNPEGDEPGGT